MNYIRINEEVKIPKGNFSFVYDITQNDDLYNICVEMERKIFISANDCIKDMRTVLEKMALDIECRDRYPDHSKEDRKRDIEQLNNEMNRNAAHRNQTQGAAGPNQYVNAKGLLRKHIEANIFSVQNHVINTFKKIKPELLGTIRPNPSETEETRNRKILIEIIYSFYSISSETAHNNSSGQDTVFVLMETLYNLFTILYKVDQPPRFRLENCPYGNYYPIPKNYYESLDLFYYTKQKIYVKEQGNEIVYAVLKEANFHGGRENNITDMLWNNMDASPDNMLIKNSILGEGNYARQVYTFPKKPRRLSPAMLAGCSFGDCVYITEGIASAIRFAHSAVPKVALRGINCNNFYICTVNSKPKAFLVDFSVAKDWNDNQTVIEDFRTTAKKINSLKRFVAPEVLEGSDTDEDTLCKADIYSFGKLAEYIFENCQDEKAKAPIFKSRFEQYVNLLTRETPDQRPDIVRAMEIFHDITVSRTVAIRSEKGKRSVQQDAFFLSGTQTQTGDNVFITKETELPFIAAVFDGIGGGRRGGDISIFAAKKTQDFFLDAVSPDTESLNRFAVGLCTECESFCKQNHLSNSGTSFALAAITQNHVYSLNIGDCRVYKYHNETLTQISEDHRSKIFHNRLYQYLGMNQDDARIEPSLFRESLDKGDTVIITTDGLTDFVSDSEIAAVVKSNSSSSDILNELTAALERKEYSDNITVIVYKHE